MTSDAMITDKMVEAARKQLGFSPADDVRLRAALTAANAAAWRTIDENTPRDGTEVILSDETGWVGSGFWNDGATCRRGEAGWFFEDDRQNLIIARNCCPTHWMPLPAPPQQEGE